VIIPIENSCLVNSGDCRTCKNTGTSKWIFWTLCMTIVITSVTHRGDEETTYLCHLGTTQVSQSVRDRPHFVGGGIADGMHAMRTGTRR
jgi:hypothetical protein